MPDEFRERVLGLSVSLKMAQFQRNPMKWAPGCTSIINAVNQMYIRLIADIRFGFQKFHISSHY